MIERLIVLCLALAIFCTVMFIRASADLWRTTWLYCYFCSIFPPCLWAAFTLIKGGDDGE